MSSSSSRLPHRLSGWVWWSRTAGRSFWSSRSSPWLHCSFIECGGPAPSWGPWHLLLHHDTLTLREKTGRWSCGNIFIPEDLKASSSLCFFILTTFLKITTVQIWSAWWSSWRSSCLSFSFSLSVMEDNKTSVLRVGFPVRSWSCWPTKRLQRGSKVRGLFPLGWR